ncbi:hypothetical protein GCM10023142_36770 [Anaerocolumna aminovalerica]
MDARASYLIKCERGEIVLKKKTKQNIKKDKKNKTYELPSMLDKNEHSKL